MPRENEAQDKRRPYAVHRKVITIGDALDVIKHIDGHLLQQADHKLLTETKVALYEYIKRTADSYFHKGAVVTRESLEGDDYVGT